MSITFHSLWLLLTVLCTAGIRADDILNNCFAGRKPPPVVYVTALCRVAEQLRGLGGTISSSLLTVTSASSKAFKAKVQAEKAVELAESKGLNVTKAKEAAVRATLAAEAAATAVSYCIIHSTKVGSIAEMLWEVDEELHVFSLCGNKDRDVQDTALKCTDTAEGVTAQSLSEALEGLAKLVFDDNVARKLRQEDTVFQREFMWLQQHMEEAVRAQKQAEDAAADANETAGPNTGPVGNSVASPEGSVLLLMAGLFLSSLP
ncbi:BARP protein [Trypanosoma brucei gambiense DAL972]|uniref:BARP protein n=1 Tax=Trypanosoma brucei gambiense (strain MHOM/CI/86/DAL972) TaxID=679716 RepID=C9ZZQ1_TRYB9|nr:BARP protein [Trypanosoma brucei gambiense DAL972]CBH14900.1 BARP protein [Trypanosoma brucei gambiense DAL972]|eukprot:XP_011777166.1 BARP protein [Trypanosoma brucei gambiense DAL972]